RRAVKWRLIILTINPKWVYLLLGISPRMNPILANPFRALGLIANSSEREIQKQVSTFSAYARVGKPIESDCDFPLLPPVERTEETIRAAAGKIEQPVNRLHYALFWFLSSNHIDETALG